MSKINSMYQKAVRIQVFVCGLLFSVFSFVYLFVFQRDVLEALHYTLAHGKTHFSPLGSALVMTLTLILLTWGVNRLVGIKGKLRTLAYVPALFVLMAISDVGKDVYLHGGNSLWLWLLPLLICGFIGISFWCKKVSRIKLNTDIKATSLIGNNLLILLIGCISTVTVGNTDAVFHHELEIERHIRNKDFSQAMNVGSRSLESSRTLTALRAMAMSNAGQLGEKLFTYPQYYGADGLFFADDSLQTLRYTNDSIYAHLGARPYNGGEKMVYLSNICYNERGKFTALDYYLSALLLKKRVDSFAQVIADFYEPADSLPRHYNEAILLYKDKHPDYPFAITDSTLIHRFTAYKYRRTEFYTKTEEKNQMRREYGDTYWWYHDYQK